MDSTGLHALRDVVTRFRRAGARVILSDVHAQPMAALPRSALGDEIPEDDLVGNIDDALNVAREHLGSSRRRERRRSDARRYRGTANMPGAAHEQPHGLCGVR